MSTDARLSSSDFPKQNYCEMNKKEYNRPAVKILLMADKLMDVIEQSVSENTHVIDDGETILDAKPLPSYSVWEE